MMNETEKREVVEREMDTVWKLCVMRLSGYERSSIEDTVQEVFVRWLDKAPRFESHEHERAWFIRTTLNCCVDVYRDGSRRASTPLEECDYLIGHTDADITLGERELIRRVLELPESYRDVVCLYYILGYSTDEIARILKKLPGTVRRELSRAREKLRDLLGEW